jgi:hypothetical protein
VGVVGTPEAAVSFALIFLGAVVAAWLAVGAWAVGIMIAKRLRLLCTACYAWDLRRDRSSTCPNCGLDKRTTRDQLRQAREPLPEPRPHGFLTIWRALARR